MREKRRWVPVWGAAQPRTVIRCVIGRQENSIQKLTVVRIDTSLYITYTVVLTVLQFLGYATIKMVL